LNALNADETASKSSGDDRMAAQAVVEREAEYIVTRLNELSPVMNGIVAARQSVLLGNTGALYELSNSPVRASNLRVIAISAVKFSLIGLFVGLMFGLMLALVLGALSKKR